MKARSRALCENSLSCALSAIEIYNKPDFRHREQIFCVLMVIAWESLLKAKILADNRNRLRAIHVRDGRRYKKNRSGQYLTISIKEAMAQCHLSPIVIENLEHLIELRDAAVHLTAASKQLPYIVFTLGAASLRNYSRLIRSWFGVGLSDYNFYILPLGFEYPFKALSMAEISKEPMEVAAIVEAVNRARDEERIEDGDFSLVCELRTTLVSAKKVTESTDLVAKIDANAPDALIISRDVRPIDRYPLTYTEIFNRLRQVDPYLKKQRLDQLIRDRRIKGDPRYSCYNYSSKRAEANGPKPTTPVLYNDAFVQLARAELCQEGLPLIQALPVIDVPVPASRSDAIPAADGIEVVEQRGVSRPTLVS